MQYTETVFSRKHDYTDMVIQMQAGVRQYTGMSFTANLIAFREAKGWQQSDLAEKVGVAQETVSRWETGARELKGKNRRKVAEALGVTEADFFTGAAKPSASEGPQIVTAPIMLPSLDVLTSMCQTLLDVAEEEPDRASRARTLARSFGSIFQSHLTPPGPIETDTANSGARQPRVDDENRPEREQ